MRIEQLVMYGPTEDDRVRFSPRLTVFSGLLPEERNDFLQTLIDAITGRLPNASLVYTNRNGRKIYADRTGATFADNGTSAPAPFEVLGQDPETVRTLLTLSAADLGIGAAVSIDSLRQQLTEARSTLERRRTEWEELSRRARDLARLENELESLRSRLGTIDDEIARWQWLQKRRHLDELQAELNLNGQAARGRTDQQILASVDALRSYGEAWTDLATEASELREQLGPLPAVSQSNLALVAATPETLPADFQSRFDAWRSAADLRKAADADLALHSSPPVPPEDPLVAAFAELDQSQLWSRHQKLIEANEAYEQISVNSPSSELSTDAEDRIETAHLAVVRAQNEVDRFFSKGVFAAGVMALCSLPLAQSVGSIPAVMFMLAAVATIAACVVLPRRRLAAAERAEEQELAGANADSWLGLHLRRLDHLSDPEESRRVARIAKDRAAAQVAWDEIAGAVAPADLTERAAEVKAYALAIDPKMVARKRDDAKNFAAATRQAEDAARTSLTSGLEAYGFTKSSSRDLDPEQLTEQLKRRVQAGDVARRAHHLTIIEQREQESAKRLAELLRQLGFVDGPLEKRLERAIASVASARARENQGERTQDELHREINALIADLRATAKRSWVSAPEADSEPPSPQVLEARCAELAEMIAATRRPDTAAAEQRLTTADSVVTALEERLDHLGTDGGSPKERLLMRLRRTTALSGEEESVPVLIDDAIRGMEDGARLELLDVLVEMSSSVQIIVLSDDPLVTAWARQRSADSTLVLYEAGPPEPGFVTSAKAPAAALDKEAIPSEATPAISPSTTFF